MSKPTPPSTPVNPTSLRFTEDEIAFLDGLATFYSATRGGQWGRADVIRRILSRAKPPVEDTPLGAECRRLYDLAFGGVET